MSLRVKSVRIAIVAQIASLQSLSVDSEASVEDQDWNVPIVKYSYCSVHRLKSLVQLDWEIYQNVRLMVTEIEITEDRTLDQDDEKESIRRLRQINCENYDLNACSMLSKWLNST